MGVIKGRVQPVGDREPEIVFVELNQSRFELSGSLQLLGEEIGLELTVSAPYDHDET